MSVSISHQPQQTEWMRLNNVEVNLAVVYMPSFNSERIDPTNVSSFEIRDAATASALQNYVDSRRVSA